MTREADHALAVAKGYNQQKLQESFVQKMLRPLMGDKQKKAKVTKRLKELFDADDILANIERDEPIKTVWDAKVPAAQQAIADQIGMSLSRPPPQYVGLESDGSNQPGAMIDTNLAGMYESPQGFTQAIPQEVIQAMNGGLAAFSPNQRMQQGLMQTYRPPVRMANGGDLGVLQSQINSDIYQNLTGYFGREKDKKIYELSDRYGITPTEVLNAYSEGFRQTDEGKLPVPLAVGEDSIPADIQMPGGSALNFLEQLVGPTAFDAVKDNVVDPTKEWLSDRLQNISAENRGTLNQDILGKGFFQPDEQGGSTEDPGVEDPGVEDSGVMDLIRSAAFSATVGDNQLRAMDSLSPPPGASGLPTDDISAIARALRDLEESRLREAIPTDPNVSQNPLGRAADFVGGAFAGEGEETNIQDLAGELDDYFKQSWYETSSLQQRDESPAQRIMVGNLDAEQQERLARAIAAGGKFITAESIDEFFKDDEGYKELAPDAKGAAADNEKNDKEVVDSTDAAAKEVVDSTDAAVTGAAVRPRVVPSPPPRKPAGPELQQEAMDAVASGSVDSFLDKLSQKDLLAMAVGFLGATSVTAGTKAALANLLKSKAAADALALAKEELVIKRDKVGADTALLAYRYASLAQANGITANGLAGVVAKNPLFGELSDYMAAGFGTKDHDLYIGPYKGEKHKAAQDVEALRLARLLNTATGSPGSPRVRPATNAVPIHSFSESATLEQV